MASFSLSVNPASRIQSHAVEALPDTSSKGRQIAAVLLFAVVNLAVSIGVCTVVFSALAN